MPNTLSLFECSCVLWTTGLAMTAYSPTPELSHSIVTSRCFCDELLDFVLGRIMMWQPVEHDAFVSEMSEWLTYLAQFWQEFSKVSKSPYQ